MVGFIFRAIIITEIDISYISFGIKFRSPYDHGMAFGISAGKIVGCKSDGLVISESVFEPKVERFFGCVTCLFCYDIVFREYFTEEGLKI